MKDPLPPMLIVDDEKNMRSSLETVMHDEGYDVVAAESAEMALELVGEQPFFMVITDARLGGMSGYDFLKEMAKRESGPPSPHDHRICHAKISCGSHQVRRH